MNHVDPGDSPVPVIKTLPVRYGSAPAFTAKVKTAPTPKAPQIKSTSHSRARLSLVLLAYLVAMLCVLATAPYQFAMPTAFRIGLLSNWRQMPGDVVLLIPAGFLFPLTRRREAPSFVLTIVAAVALWASIGLVLEFEPQRAPVLSGAVANAAGALIGAYLLHALNVRISKSARLAGRLSLEIPLMALIYLLVPLILASSLGTIDDPPRILLLIPLGLLTSRLLAAVHEHHFGPAAIFSNRTMGVVATLWMAVAMAPAILRQPARGAAIALLVGLATMYELSRPPVQGAQRRFEADALRKATPYIVLYLVSLIALPFMHGHSPWSWSVSLVGGDGVLARQVIHALEPTAALVTLGYILAEARGRRELPFRRIGGQIVAECMGLAVLIEGSRGFVTGEGASVAELLLMVLGAGLGAAMYHHQRERVRWILIHRPATEAPAIAAKAVRVGSGRVSERA